MAAEESHRQMGQMLHGLAGARLLCGWMGGDWLGLLSTGLRHMATVTVALSANTTGKGWEQDALSKYLTNVNKVR